MSSRARLSSIFAATASSTASSPSPRSAPIDALAAATERARAGTLRPADAHHLFDQLLRQPTSVPERALNGFLAALAQARPSSACSDSPALAVALFNRRSRNSAGPRVLPTTVHTYAILMDCCCRARRPDLAFAFFGRFLRTGLAISAILFNSLLKGLCDAKRTDESLDVLLCRMPELGCVPNVISYSVLLKSFCSEKKSQRAVELLQIMAKEGGVCSPNVVSYNTVIDGLFKECEVAKACDLFHEMVQQGISPDVMTYSSIIRALGKARAMDKAEMFFRQMVDKGVQPDIFIYTNLIHGYATLGQWKEAVRVFNLMVDDGIVPDHHIFNILIHAYDARGMMGDADAMLIFHEMKQQGVKSDVVTYLNVIAAFCRMGRLDDAMDIFTQMIDQGLPPNQAVYHCLIKGFCTHGGLVKVKELLSEMISKARRIKEAKYLFDSISANKLVPSIVTYSLMITNFINEGLLEEADDIFSAMEKAGCAPNSRLLNHATRLLLEKGEIIRAANYLAKIDKKNFSLEASTTEMLISLFSRKEAWQEHIKLFPAKYQFLVGASYS
ncbi:hypothetical protein SETIT_7G058100v2 [Setaria italica]|uniref:Pentacotripeptide-repeat region of PRORP domain-containing protein n=1 Tax=Setaria italica TaxID=4555 RepID=A0A368RSM9_SETIT|nr:hypothetical protein SETIT_7G058100v2 [Setaria italica]